MKVLVDYPNLQFELMVTNNLQPFDLDDNDDMRTAIVQDYLRMNLNLLLEIPHEPDDFIVESIDKNRDGYDEIWLLGS